MFYSNGRGGELSATLDWVYRILKHQGYVDGTLYYDGIDTFFFFLSRLLQVSTSVRQRFGPLFIRRVSEQFGRPGSSLMLAMRIIAAGTVHLHDSRDYSQLLMNQDSDGSWKDGWMYKYGASGVLIGNVGLTTALAVQAIKVYQGLQVDA